MYTVYQIYCRSSRRYYYGCTRTGVEKRKSCHISAAKKGKHANSEFQSDFNVYGLNVFSFSTLAENLTKRQALSMESTAISSDPDCYNVLIGMTRRPELARSSGIKASETRKQRGWSPSEETRKKMSLAKLGKPGNRRGTKATPEQIERNRAARAGKPLLKKRKPVICSDGRRWESASIAAEAIGCGVSNVAKVCNGKRAHVKGLHLWYEVIVN